MESKTYSQKVDEWLFAKSGCHIIDFCRKFGYYNLALKIMSLDESDEKKSKAIMAKDAELKALYIAASKDESTIARKGKNRSFTAYFKHVITGWVVEDLVMAMLKKQGIDIVNNGHDSNRRIAIGKDVTQDADFRITVGKNTRKIELTGEFNQILSQDGFIEKRAPALVHVWKEKGIWLYRDLMHGKYVLIDFATEKVKLHLRRHNNVLANWSKDVHRYVLSENGKKVRDDKLLAAELISVVGCSIKDKEQPSLDEIVDVDSPPHDYEIGGTRKGKKVSLVSQKGSTGVDEMPKKPIVEKKKEYVKQSTAQETKSRVISKPKVSKGQEPPPQQESEEELPVDYDYGDSDFV